MASLWLLPRHTLYDQKSERIKENRRRDFIEKLEEFQKKRKKLVLGGISLVLQASLDSFGHR